MGGELLAYVQQILGFLIDGYEDEIFNLMNNICERRSIVKGKGVQGTTNFDREKETRMEHEGQRGAEKGF